MVKYCKQLYIGDGFGLANFAKFKKNDSIFYSSIHQHLSYHKWNITWLMYPFFAVIFKIIIHWNNVTDPYFSIISKSRKNNKLKRPICRGFINAKLNRRQIQTFLQYNPKTLQVQFQWVRIKPQYPSSPSGNLVSMDQLKN